MSEIVYISQDVNVQIDEQPPIDSNFEDVDLIFGNMPRGGNAGDLIVKESSTDFDARWKTVEEAGLRHIYYDTVAGWSAQTSLISETGAVYIYEDRRVINGQKIPGVKIGDGLAYVVDLPFVGDDTANDLLNHINDAVVHVSTNDRGFWNNKVSAVIDPNNSENLILTTEDVNHA